MQEAKAKTYDRCEGSLFVPPLDPPGAGTALMVTGDYYIVNHSWYCYCYTKQDYPSSSSSCGDIPRDQFS